MRELRDLLSAYYLLSRSGERGVLATVVATEGSTYRRPGARMLLLPDGSRFGTISGGCLEREVVARAAELSTGSPLLMRYDATAADDAVLGYGLGCQGAIDVLLEAVGPAPCLHLDFLAACVRGGSPGVLATVYRSSGEHAPPVGSRMTLAGGKTSGELAEAAIGSRVHDDAAGLLAKAGSATRGRCSSVAYEMSGCRADVLLELFVAPLRLVVFGGGPDAAPLARLAAGLGWEATIVHPKPALPGGPAAAEPIDVVECEPREVVSRIDLGGRVAAVVMSHDYLIDLELARVLVPSNVCYLGLLGPRRRGQRLMADLEKQGIAVSPERLARAHFPAGLDIGAESPEEIALAIAAEITAALAGRSGGRLRDRTGPTHG